MICIRGITKSFGGVRALAGVDLDLHPGEVHALCGENGAGKSTLNRILSGAVKPDSGSVSIDGKPIPLGSVSASEEAGVAMVHQESAAFLHLSAVENHQIMREPTQVGGLWLDRAEMKRRTEASLREMGETFSLDEPLEVRSVAQRQMVAIARAVAADCKLLILDEPTASLSARETQALFRVVREMRAKGVAILYVSHRMDEVFELSDRVTILRDGQHVATKPASETTREELIRLMVGRDVEFEARTSVEPGDPLLEVRRLTRAGVFRDISFTVRAGEVVAMAGLVGAGRSEVARALFGLDAVDGGEVVVRGGIALVPEDRQHEGLHLPMSVRENLSMAHSDGALIPKKREAEEAERMIASLGIKTASDLAAVSSLSGGNQQKVLLGKWLATSPKVLILDEPTRGVDVGAKDQIHRLIGELAKQGVAVLVISSEMSEVLALADRVLVMRQGQIAGEIRGSEATQEKILELALPEESEEGPVAAQKKGVPRELAVGALLLATLVAVSVVNPAFVSLDNLRDILVKVSPALIVGTMMTLVILAREIDISVGSLMGLCAAVLGIACSPDRMGLPVAVGVGLCLGVGAVGGLLNGAMVSYARVPSIVVTLGMLTVLRGATELLMGGKWIEKMPDGLRAFGTGAALGVPYSVWMALATVLIGVWVTKRTRFGIQVVALGSNPSAAALRGVGAHKVRLAAFVLTGLAAGVAALFSATQLQVIESGFGSGFELVVVASVIVGGTSIRGGRGSVFGTVLGALLLGMISTVLIFLRLGESATYWERAIQGGFILLAVVADHFGRRAKTT